MFTILIPTYNNIDYLKICLDSLKKNSEFNHQIIIHVNEGEDGTLDFVKKIIIIIPLVMKILVCLRL